MGRLRFVLLVSLTLGHTLWAGDLKFLHFIVKVPIETPEGSRLYVTGNVKELGNWAPNAREMYSLGGNAYQLDVSLPAGTEEVQLKITRGDYSLQPANGFGETFLNFHIKLPEEATTVIYSVPHWSDLPPRLSRPGLETIENVTSRELANGRRLYVKLPASYATDPNRRYPVVYLHDGQGFFGSDLRYAGIGMRTDAALERLSAAGVTEEAILVGIESTWNRDEEYEWDLLGILYADFVVGTVKPLIDRRYRTLPGRESTFTMGCSLGASIAFNLAWLRSDVFSAAAGLSLPVFNKENALLNMVNAGKKPVGPVRFYFDHGDQGQDAGYEGSASRFYQALREREIPAANIEYRRFRYGDHTSEDWARRIDQPLKFLLGKCSAKIEAAGN